MEYERSELNRPWCNLFGCQLDECVYAPPECIRCGQHYYEGFVHLEESIFWGSWFAIRGAFWKAVRLVWRWRRCDVCKKWFWCEDVFPVCSDKCWESYVPF